MKGDLKWVGYNLALGREKTRKSFNVTDDFSEASSFLDLRDKSMNVHQIEVEVVNLDSIFAEIVASIPQPRIFLKMDTQGYDLEVMKGAKSSIKEIIALQSEISVNPIYEHMPYYLQSLEYYEALGFRLAGLFEVFRHKASDTIVEMNCLMTRPEELT